MCVQVIAGLGNPGSEYSQTRHNLGFWLVDAIAESVGAVWKRENRFEAEAASARIEGRTVYLLKPLTFMNESGRAVGAFLRYYRFETSTLLAVFDEYQLPVGRFKVSVSGGDGGHNGTASLIAHAGADFVRYRLGIGGPRPGGMAMADFVLSRLTPAERSILHNLLPTFLDGLRLLLREGPAKAMNLLNRNPTNHEQSASEILPGDLHP